MTSPPRLRRLAPTSLAATPLAASLLAVLLALLLGGLFLEVRGTSALAAYRLMVERALLTPYGLTETLVRAAPLLIVAAGLLIALRAGVWNIGLDGQVLVGALAAGVAAPALLSSLPPPLLWLAAAAAGLLGGLAWAALPAILRARWGLNEIITTLMMNYVALNLTSYLVKGPAKDPAAVPPQTRAIPPNLRLPDLPGTEIHLGLLVALLAVAAVALLFRTTLLGFSLDVVGRAPRAARHAGLPVPRLIAIALLASGAFAGLAGANDVLGVKGLFQGNWNPGYGFAAFAVAYLARLRAPWIIPFALLLAWLTLGAELTTRPLGIPPGFADLVEGLMLLSFALAVALERRFAASAPDLSPDPTPPAAPTAPAPNRSQAAR